MRTLVLCAVLALIAFSACYATSDPVTPHLVNWRPDEVELCALIGENSGCSGCALGTKGLCKWVEITGVHGLPLQGRHDTVLVPIPGPDRVAHECLPTRWFYEAEALYPGVFFDGDYLCPVDPKREPIIRDNATDVNSIFTFPIRKAHLLLSKTHHRKLIDFPASNWTVDRTSRYGVIGGLGFYGSVTNAVGGFEHSSPDAWYDCTALNNKNDMQPYRGWYGYRAGEDAEVFARPNDLDELLYMCPANECLIGPSKKNPIGTALPIPDSTVQFWRETEKWCANTYLNAYASTRCPQYGVAVSGICQSTFWRFYFNCRDSHVVPQFSVLPGVSILTGTWNNGIGLVPPPALPFGPILNMRVVDDRTPFCLTDMPLEISGEMESLAGLHKSIPFLNTYDGFECYDCCD